MRTRKPKPKSAKKEFWGDQNEGARFDRMLGRKFGTHFGSRRDAIATLDISRRLMNMYITGERAIPDEVWIALKKLPDIDKAAAKPKRKVATPKIVKGRRVASPVAGRKAIPAILYIDDIDPLS